MSRRVAVVGLLFCSMAGCAGARKQAPLQSANSAPGLLVGHSDDGEVVVAASHYDAMNGLAVTDADLGLAPRNSGDGRMLCKREVITGSHMPHWTCRYQEDIAQGREAIRNALSLPVNGQPRQADGTVHSN